MARARTRLGADLRHDVRVHQPGAAIFQKAADAGWAQVRHPYGSSEEDARVFDLIFGILRLGKPVAAPPGVPADRLAALRVAFMATMRDKLFLADAEKMRIQISALSGEAVQERVRQLYGAPREVLAAAKLAIKQE